MFGLTQCFSRTEKRFHGNCTEMVACFSHILLEIVWEIQVQDIEGELNSRKQEEAKRRRDVQEIRQQITAFQRELSNLDETVDYQVTENSQLVVLTVGLIGL